jgi:hypothetical protein
MTSCYNTTPATTSSHTTHSSSNLRLDLESRQQASNLKR